MKTKDQIIQEAYGNYWDTIKDHVNMEHGSLDVYFWTLNELIIPFDRIGFGDRRPQSLKGIENNNGWTKMNDKRDNLPDEHCKCWLWTEDGIMFGDYNSTTKGFYGYKEVKFSHYLIIQEPKPPLF